MSAPIAAAAPRIIGTDADSQQDYVTVQAWDSQCGQWHEVCEARSVREARSIVHGFTRTDIEYEALCTSEAPWERSYRIVRTVVEAYGPAAGNE
jgi:hypothetical protein